MSAGTLGDGTVIARGDGGAPEVFNNMAEVVTITPATATNTPVDATHLASTSMEFLQGTIVDQGSIALNGTWVSTDAEFSALRVDQAAGAAANFKITWPNGVIFSFNAFVETVGIGEAAVGAKVPFSVSLKINGTPVWG